MLNTSFFFSLFFSLFFFFFFFFFARARGFVFLFFFCIGLIVPTLNNCVCCNDGTQPPPFFMHVDIARDGSVNNLLGKNNAAAAAVELAQAAGSCQPPDALAARAARVVAQAGRLGVLPRAAVRADAELWAELAAVDVDVGGCPMCNGACGGEVLVGTGCFLWCRLRRIGCIAGSVSSSSRGRLRRLSAFRLHCGVNRVNA
jgi:hypothetical protein